MKYLLVVGEASADEHASHLITALKNRDKDAVFAFIGGDLMQKASGVEPLVHYKEIAVMGFFSVFSILHKIKDTAQKLADTIVSFKPDMVVPLDYGGFNLRYTLPLAHKQGIPVYYYIPPKVWAWKSWRIKTLKKYVRESFVILPFEERYFSERGLSTHFLGNPSVESVGSYYDINRETRTKEAELTIALLPGSRKSEISKNFPIMLEAFDRINSSKKALVAVAPSIEPDFFSPWISGRSDVFFIKDKTYEILSKSHIAWVTSGTATLETALIGTPQVVCYRSSGRRMERWIFENFFPVKFFSLVNLILDSSLLQELLSDRMTAENIVNTTQNILSDTSFIENGYVQLRSLVGREKVSERVADKILSIHKEL